MEPINVVSKDKPFGMMSTMVLSLPNAISENYIPSKQTRQCTSIMLRPHPIPYQSIREIGVGSIVSRFRFSCTNSNSYIQISCKDVSWHARARLRINRVKVQIQYIHTILVVHVFIKNGFGSTNCTTPQQAVRE